MSRVTKSHNGMMNHLTKFVGGLYMDFVVYLNKG